MSDVEVTPPAGLETGTDKPPNIVSQDKPPVAVSEELPQPVGEGGRRRRWVLPTALGGIVFVVVLAIFIASTVLTRGTPPNGTGTLAWLDVAAPIELTADAGTFEVTLLWIQPSGGLEVSGYDIYRNGAFQVHLDGTPTTFVDEAALPAQRYEYEIEARSGKLSSDRASIHVQTSTAPLGMARLDGTYDVTVRTDYDVGYDQYPRSANLTFIFEPTCEAGPCSSRLRIPENEDLGIILSRRVATYRGSSTGLFGVACDGRPITSNVTVALKVVRAGAVDGQWAATELVGRITHLELPQASCGLTTAGLSLSASLVR